MSDATPATDPAPVQSPPPTAQPARDPLPDPRQTLHRLANELMRAHNRKLLVEFLQLRRALR
jgi:hypothetical protein